MMRTSAFRIALVGMLLLGAVATMRPSPCFGEDAKWKGVDETVVEKFAADAGHPARKPYINTDQGDLLLFAFLVAGAIGGFIGGYAFRALFPPRASSRENHAPPE
jgi:ABC-type cobalt transport system substrate-binding protein